MLNAIRTAQTNITFETFVFRDGVGATFVEELSNAARRGVQVHMLLDWLGSRTMDSELARGSARRRLRPAPVSPALLVSPRPAQQSHPPQVAGVDGKIGFTGGVGMGIEWKDGLNGRAALARDALQGRRARSSRRCRRCSSTTGSRPPAAYCTARSIFRGCRPTSATWTRRCSAARRSAAPRACTSWCCWRSRAAKTSIDIENAYFVPDKLTVEALCSAAQRGVRVRIVVPGQLHRCAHRPLGRARTVWRVARSGNPDLRISADDDALQGAWSSTACGAPWARRISTIVRSASTTRRTSTCSARSSRASRSRLIDADIEQSRRMVLKKWRNRKFGRRVNERLALLLRSQL